VRFHLMPKRDELDMLFREIVAGRAEVLFGGISGSPKPMIDFALRERLPAVRPMRYFVEAGGLMSYGVSQAEAQRAPVHAARYVDRILRGTPPAELAVEQPSRFELALNLKTARAIGLAFPQSVVLRADAVIG
jgi:putative ABC transport system substrate-binding protein